jgi:hypothetical protein
MAMCRARHSLFDITHRGAPDNQGYLWDRGRGQPVVSADRQVTDAPIKDLLLLLRPNALVLEEEIEECGLWLVANVSVRECGNTDGGGDDGNNIPLAPRGRRLCRA